MGVLPAKSGLPSFPLASSSMQLRALVGWCGWLLTTTERHSERFNTAFIPVSIFPLLLLYSVFHQGLVVACFSSRRFSEQTWHQFSFLFLKKKGCQGLPFYRFTLGHLANRHRTEHATSHFSLLTCQKSQRRSEDPLYILFTLWSLLKSLSIDAL